MNLKIAASFTNSNNKYIFLYRKESCFVFLNLTYIKYHGHIMIKQFFIDRRPHMGLAYSQYMDSINKKIESINPSDPEKDLLDTHEIIKLNLYRANRINKTYVVDETLCMKAMKINKKQLWMILTEDWCGDSAQSIPYIAKIAECNPLIELKFLLRNENTDIMNFYLTDGESRSIPKLVAFDTEGNELFQWGPRPQEADKLVKTAKLEGKSKDQFLNELHLWYAKDKGKSLEKEFSSIIEEQLSTPRS